MIRLPLVRRVVSRLAFCTLCLLAVFAANNTAHAELRAGFGKVDITPDRPLRLSGYGNRKEVFEKVDRKLFTRVLALEIDGKLHLLAATDTIGFPAAVTAAIAEKAASEFKVTRERLVLTCTHSHTSPQLAGGILNIFATPLTEDQAQQTERYTRIVIDAVLSASRAAIKDLAPSQLAWGETKVGFAVNRRVLKEGQWTGFGVTPDAPVDHSLPVLRVTAPDGKLRGLVYNYACHCTTLGPSFNQISPDWAGFACEGLEAAHPGTTVLGVIGCGADANPNPRDKPEQAPAHGKALADAATLLLKEGKFTDLSAPLRTSFGEARLKIAPYSRETLEKRLAGTSVQAKRQAEQLLAETNPRTDYPCPIHVWQFGPSDQPQLTMIFLGGEVVVDYTLRLKRELAPLPLWVSAYTDDVFAYVASERVRREGGYEVDGSMIYYNLPGPWAEGTEDQLVARIRELVKGVQ